jgi:membrane-associated phospholipid phosphatase
VRASLRVAAASLLALTGLALLVAGEGGAPGDRRLLELAQADAGDRLEPVARLVDQTSGYATVGVVTAIVVAVLLHARRAADGAFVAAAVAGAVAGTTALKQLVERPRPDLLTRLDEVSAYSFPSGHAAATAALATALVLVTTGSRRRLRLGLATAVLLLVVAAGQLVLALHHPSDVLAGWLWAGGWTTAVWSVRARWCHRRRRVRATGRR